MQPADSIARLVTQHEAMATQLRRIEEKLDRHDTRHREERDELSDGQVKLEGRLTKLEDALAIRSIVGGVGLVVSAALAHFGIPTWKPGP